MIWDYLISLLRVGPHFIMRTDSAASVCPHKLFNVSSSSFRSDLEYTEISTVMLPRFIVGIVCYSNIFLNVILWGGEWLTDSNYITVGGCGGCCSRWECPKILLRRVWWAFNHRKKLCCYQGGYAGTITWSQIVRWGISGCWASGDSS